MIRILYYTENDDSLNNNLSLQDLPAALQNQQSVLWVDFEGETPEASEPVLLQSFHFHPLAVDDALQETHVPRIDDWGDYLYVVLHAVGLQRQNNNYISHVEVDVFLGENYVVTHHDMPVQSLEKVWAAVQKDRRHLKQGADHVLYRLVDELVSNYMHVVDELDDEIDELEKELFDHATSGVLEKTFSLKRALLKLRRTLSPQREVLNKLARDDYRMIDAKDRVYFRDVYDHLVRLHDITESLRDLVAGVLDTYLSVVNNRMNDVMKTLTLITTLFMPISFVAGFFGMNFFEPSYALPGWTGYPVFIVLMLFIGLLPVLMYLWMRRRGWM